MSRKDCWRVLCSDTLTTAPCILKRANADSKYGTADIRAEPITVESESSGSHDYHALSYTWGSNVLDHKVMVVSGECHHVLPITKNAHDALRHIRHSASVRSLWVDAICINQQDVEERNDQVARMAAIYKLAKKVIIWLGPEENNSSLAIDGLKLLSSKIEVHWPTKTISAANPAEGTFFDLMTVLRLELSSRGLRRILVQLLSVCSIGKC